ncbi:hypothetical protein NDU88_003667 [Pleurodeles waltl]|uniref:Uncharacterized protein n=1 Tax=Pleurodeles waltl TaxID=8319 RepID=A0AAV7SGL8_PLEWA|nr:hypothetical protein NDU88_003667 [Pleurodeles waltl]
MGQIVTSRHIVVNPNSKYLPSRLPQVCLLCWGRGHEAKDGARLIRLLRRGLNFSCYPGPPPGQIDGERVRGPVWVTRAPVEPRASLAEPVGDGRLAPRPGACRRVNAGSRTERVSGHAAGRWSAAVRGKPCVSESAEDGVTVTGGACGPSVPILASKEKQQERGPGCREPCCGADPACGTVCLAEGASSVADTHFEHRHTPAERAGPREGRPEGGKYRTLGRARSDRGATCWMVVPVVAYCVNGGLAPELGTSMVGPGPQSMKDRPAASGETGIPG